MGAHVGGQEDSKKRPFDGSPPAYLRDGVDEHNGEVEVGVA